MDPVTLSAEPGRFAVAINANDIAVMGARPRWLLASVLLPPGTSEEVVTGIMDQLGTSCRTLQIDLIGGHTEVTPSVAAPIVVACMIGEVAPERLVTSAGAQPGDTLVLVGPIALEGTAILAREYASALVSRGVPAAIVESAAALLDSPGISVLPAVEALTSVIRPHAMHDPTEGGVMGAVWELATASHAGVRLDADRIPILPECGAVCSALGIDPLRLLASGSLLAAVASADVPAALSALEGAGLPHAIIGTILPPGTLTLHRDGLETTLPPVNRDELARWSEESTT
jgi:hydrogenase maturation factor